MLHVIGNATIDIVIQSERFSMPGDSLVAKGGIREDFGGKDVNQAVTVARRGTPVRLMAAIDDDEIGRRIRAQVVNCIGRVGRAVLTENVRHGRLSIASRQQE